MSLVVRDGFIVISYTDNKTTFLQMAQDTWDFMCLPFNSIEFVHLLPLFCSPFSFIIGHIRNLKVIENCLI